MFNAPSSDLLDALDPDDFRGDDLHLIASINALISFDNKSRLVPNGMGKGNHARRLLCCAARRLFAHRAALAARGEDGEARSVEYKDEKLANGHLDFLDRKADEWMQEASVRNMTDAISGVFAKRASPDLLAKFKDQVFALAHQCYVEGALRAWTEITDERKRFKTPINDAPPPPEDGGLREALAANERDRTKVASVVTTLEKALASYSWLRDGRGSYAYDDDRWRDEFKNAFDVIEAAFQPLKRLACDFEHCPKTHAEAVKARPALDASPAAPSPSLPIDETWLKANGFVRSDLPPHIWRSESIGVENLGRGRWAVDTVDSSYHFKTRAELIALFEAVTGQRWRVK